MHKVLRFTYTFKQKRLIEKNLHNYNKKLKNCFLINDLNLNTINIFLR